VLVAVARGGFRDGDFNAVNQEKGKNVVPLDHPCRGGNVGELPGRATDLDELRMPNLVDLAAEHDYAEWMKRHGLQHAQQVVRAHRAISRRGQYKIRDGGTTASGKSSIWSM